MSFLGLELLFSESIFCMHIMYKLFPLFRYAVSLLIIHLPYRVMLDA